MNSLELKIPPPVVAVTIAALMWGLSRITPALVFGAELRGTCAIMIAAIGLAFDIAGVCAFWRAKTTINPMKPGSSARLVNSGIYRVTRNPMYVGLCLVLTAWAVYLWNVWTLPGPALFVLYINRFQIVPEERALAALFGAEFSAYKARVRRWL